MNLDEIEIRVLGALMEKQRVTPDAYPLTLNGLRAACNQATARDPVLDLDEPSIRVALQSLGRRRYTRLASGAGSRAAKYRHLLDETLRIDAGQQALLAVLMLRGPQTPGELRQRAERLHSFRDADSLNGTLNALLDRGLAQRLPRRPGQKEERYAHSLGTQATGATVASTGVVPSDRGASGWSSPVATDVVDAGPAAKDGTDAGYVAPSAKQDTDPVYVASAGKETTDAGTDQAYAATDPMPTDRAADVQERLNALEAQVAELRNQLRDLRAALGE